VWTALGKTLPQRRLQMLGGYGGNDRRGGEREKKKLKLTKNLTSKRDKEGT